MYLCICLGKYPAPSPRAPAGTLCIRTLIEHIGGVFRLQFDEFQIVFSRFGIVVIIVMMITMPLFSHDDTISWPSSASRLFSSPPRRT